MNFVCFCILYGIQGRSQTKETYTHNETLRSVVGVKGFGKGCPSTAALEPYTIGFQNCAIFICDFNDKYRFTVERSRAKKKKMFVDIFTLRACVLCVMSAASIVLVSEFFLPSNEITCYCLRTIPVYRWNGDCQFRVCFGDLLGSLLYSSFFRVIDGWCST